jgi:transposase-like protein
VKRARIVLLAAEGRSARSIAEEVGVEPRIVSNWRRRFAERGLGGLNDRPRAFRRWRDNVFVERLWRSVKYEEVYLRESRFRKSGQVDRWSFCLIAGTLCPTNQETR